MEEFPNWDIAHMRQSPAFSWAPTACVTLASLLYTGFWYIPIFPEKNSMSPQCLPWGCTWLTTSHSLRLLLCPKGWWAEEGVWCVWTFETSVFCIQICFINIFYFYDLFPDYEENKMGYTCLKRFRMRWWFNLTTHSLEISKAIHFQP